MLEKFIFNLNFLVLLNYFWDLSLTNDFKYIFNWPLCIYQPAAYLLLKDDIEEGDLNRPEMTAKLVCTLETAMHRAMQEKQYSAVASNAKVLMKLVGLEAKIKS